MASEEPDAPTAAIPLPVLRQRRQAERFQLREAQLHVALQELHERHQKERKALSQELFELAVTRKAIRDQLWSDWSSSSLPDLGPGRLNLTPEQQLKLSAELPRADRCVHVVKQKEQVVDSQLAAVVELGEEDATSKVKYQEQEDGASSSTAGATLNGKEGPVEGVGEISNRAESFPRGSQQQEKEKEELLRELLSAKDEPCVETQCLLEILDVRELRAAYEHRIDVEDPREMEAYRRTLAAERATKRAGLWRFVPWKKVEAKRKLLELEGTAEDQIKFVDTFQGRPQLPECYKEIKNLLHIEKDPIFSKALREWNRKEEFYVLHMDRLSTRVASVRNEVYQLIGFVSVFQGVLLTAVSQSSLLYCHNLWCPIALSVLASVVCTLGVIQKLNQMNDLQRTIELNARDFVTAVTVGQQLRGPGFREIDFAQLDVKIKSYTKWKFPRRIPLYSVVVTLTLVAFIVLFPVSFWRILCKPGAPPGPPTQ